MPGSIPIINGTWRGHEASFREDRIVISVADNVPEIAIEDTIDQAISLIHQGAAKLSFRPRRRWATIGLQPGTNVIQAIARIQVHPDLEYAEPDFILYGRTTPNDHDYATGVQKWPGLINLPRAWEFTQGSASVLLAVLDSGIPIRGQQFDNVDLCDPAHPMVRDEDGRYIARHKDSTNRVINHDYVDDDDMPDDGHGHGTWVTGILAAMSNNDKGIVGTNWNSRVYIARVLDDHKQFPIGSASIVKEAMDDLILYAISKAFNHIVVNMSFGSADPSFMQPNARAYATDVIESLDEMCRDAEEFTIREELKGRCILCCAPQFNGTGATAKADYPARYAAKYGHVISVGSTFDDDTIALPGPTNEPVDPNEVTILAPGNSAPQTTLLTATSGAPTSDGTSLASPMVAGVASLMWSRNLHLTPKQIKQCIWSTGHDIPGRSRPYRRVDAGRAVGASNGSITLLTPLVEYADVPTGLVKTKPVKMRVVGCVGLTFAVKSTAMDAAFSVSTSTMSYNTPGRLRRLSGISVNYTAGVAGSTAVGSITIACVETGETWTADLKANAVKPLA